MSPSTTTSRALSAERARADAVEAGASLTRERLDELRQRFLSMPAYRLAQNAVTQASFEEVAVDRRLVTGLDDTFSHHLGDWEVTDQKKSGRCWMFAGLNLLRTGARKKMGLKNFEFSQCFTYFWDKAERANYFLEAILATAEAPLDDRTVAYLLARPIEDGGQWDMFVNLVAKYGLIPKAFMPESTSSSDSARMNQVLAAKLREGARAIRSLRSRGVSEEEIRVTVKRETLEAVYRILSIHLGTPPETIDWQWRDSDGAFHRDGRMTPREFAARYVTLPLDDYISLVHDPRPSHPPGRTYTVAHLGNVVEAPPTLYLNVALEVMKRVAAEAIRDGEPVWFGCDAGKMLYRSKGVWDAAVFDLGGLYGTALGLDKAERLLYGDSAMTHAMLFTGVDLVDGRPRRWRVENSWGDKDGAKGFYLMQDSWFDEYMFELAARKSRLPADLQAAAESEPIVLPPWDPMGALAG